MQGEDRDRRLTRDFEKALAQHLRRDAAGDSACLDAGMLAAYQERQLSADEMIAAGGHLNSCLRCREILAQLEATEHLSEMQVNELDVTELQVTKSGEIAAGAVRLLKDSRNAEAVSAGTADAVENAAVSTRKKVTIFPAKRNPLVKWAAPAGALAAGLLLWIGIRDFRSQRSAAESVQIAESRNEAKSAEPDGSRLRSDAPPAAPMRPVEPKSESLARNETPEKRGSRQSDVLRDELR